jgi:hypothetical protein
MAMGIVKKKAERMGFLNKLLSIAIPLDSNKEHLRISWLGSWVQIQPPGPFLSFW